MFSSVLGITGRVDHPDYQDPLLLALHPAADHWVEVDHEMLRYVFSLEERIDRSDYDLELARSEHEKERQDLHDQLKKKDGEIKRLRRELPSLR